MNTEAILGKFDKISEIYQLCVGVPNVLDFVGLNENSHTSVLRMILNHRREKAPVFLKSFLAKFTDKFQNLSKEDYLNARIEIQSDYIDCLIQIGKYAIVIENKIHGARDQSKQLETYIDRARKRNGIDVVYAVYLTLTGGNPSDYSLSDEFKKSLGDNLITMNFQTQVLGWLQDDVLPECKVREHLLEYSVQLYIDHLNGMLGQKNIERQMVDRLSKVVDLEITPDYYRILQQTLNDRRFELDERMMKDHESYSSAIQVLLREIEKTIPYVNEDNVAYVLKDMFKNCPPWKEKSSWIDNCANVAPFVPGYFLYEGCRYLKLTGELHCMSMIIHIRCSVDGIKDGPYILLEPDEADRQFGKEQLESIGLVRGNQWYHLPFTSFHMEKTSLLDVAIHIKFLVDGLKKSQLILLPASNGCDHQVAPTTRPAEAMPSNLNSCRCGES